MRTLLPDIAGRLFRHNVEIIKLNTAKHRQLYKETGSDQIPTTSIYLDGKLLANKPGSMSHKVAVPWILETFEITTHQSRKRDPEVRHRARSR
jgi:hypothetical protein